MFVEEKSIANTLFFIHACRENNFPSVQSFLSNNIIEGTDAIIPLNVAVSNRNYDIAKYLIIHKNIRFNALKFNNHGKGIFKNVIENHEFDLFKLLFPINDIYKDKDFLPFLEGFCWIPELEHFYDVFIDHAEAVSYFKEHYPDKPYFKKLYIKKSINKF